MGIKGLAKLLSDEAPDSIREVELSSLHGRKIAIDASMAIYQFLIAVRSGNGNTPAVMLTNAEGETTSHVQGLFNRTIRYLTEGLKPVFVFDGKPPEFKQSNELAKRRQRRQVAQAALKEATEEGNVAEQEKQSKRLVRAGQKENDDCKRLLTLMGVPIVQAPCEAEAQAAALAKEGAVYATATEDMDALTFATPVLLRKMTFANASKSLIQQLNYEKAIEGLGLKSHAEFVDLCILLGCDYCDSIKGIGPKTALKLIREHSSIENIIKKIDCKKFTVPANWVPDEKAESDVEEDDANEEKKDEAVKPIPAFVEARRLFIEHEVVSSDSKEDVDLKWKPCQEDELRKFLVDEMGFNPERVVSSIEKLKAAHKANTKPQSRMDSFFKVKPADPKQKRKAAPVDTKKKASPAKKTKTGRRR